MANENIGTIVCGWAGCTEVACVRRDRNGKFYFDCLTHGRFTLNTEEAQGEIMDRATLWGRGTPPTNTPRWIAEAWNWNKARRLSADARQPLGQAIGQPDMPNVDVTPDPPKVDVTPDPPKVDVTPAKPAPLPPPPAAKAAPEPEFKTKLATAKGFSFLEDF